MEAGARASKKRSIWFIPWYLTNVGRCGSFEEAKHLVYTMVCCGSDDSKETTTVADEADKKFVKDKFL